MTYRIASALAFLIAALSLGLAACETETNIYDDDGREPTTTRVEREETRIIGETDDMEDPDDNELIIEQRSTTEMRD